MEEVKKGGENVPRGVYRLHFSPNIIKLITTGSEKGKAFIALGIGKKCA
jgi:hypothetical protein